MNVFEAVRDSVTAREAAESYGLKVSRSGMACCPFHDDKHPSLKLDERYYCFGCQASGDAISFVARLFGLKPYDAAKKLADDFGIDYVGKTETQSVYRARDEPRPKISAQLEARKQEAKCQRVLSNYLVLLTQWQTEYAPKSPDAPLHPLFVEAIQKKEYIEYLLDEFFPNGSTEDKTAFIKEHGDELATLEKRIKGFDISNEHGTTKEKRQYAER